METWKIATGAVVLAGGVWWLSKRRGVTVETPAITKPLLKEAAKIMEKATEKVKAAVDESVQAPPGAPEVVGKVIALVKLKRASAYYIEVAMQAIQALALDKTYPDFVVKFAAFVKAQLPEVYEKWISARTKDEAWKRLYWYKPVAAASTELAFRIVQK